MIQSTSLFDYFTQLAQHPMKKYLQLSAVIPLDD